MYRLRSNHAQMQNRPSEENKYAEGSNGIDKEEDTSSEITETTSVAITTKFSNIPLEILNLIADGLNLFHFLKIFWVQTYILLLSDYFPGKSDFCFEL